MNGFLLDTNIPSETLRPVPDAKVARWLQSQSSKELQFVSVLVTRNVKDFADLGVALFNPWMS